LNINFEEETITPTYSWTFSSSEWTTCGSSCLGTETTGCAQRFFSLSVIPQSGETSSFDALDIPENYRSYTDNVTIYQPGNYIWRIATARSADWGSDSVIYPIYIYSNWINLCIPSFPLPVELSSPSRW